MDTQPPIEAAPPQEQKPKPTGVQIAIGVAGVLGAAVGYYCGFQLVVPLAIAFGVGWLQTKFPGSPPAFRIAWAVEAAQALWMAIGAVLLSAWSQVALDIGVLVVGLAWLWVRPSLGPVIFLGLYQIAAGVINVIALMSAQAASLQHKALVAHLFLRVAALLFLIEGYVKMRKRARGA